MALKSHLDPRLNQHVIKLVQDWKKKGSIQQEGFDWSSSRSNWEKAFVEGAIGLKTNCAEGRYWVAGG